VQAGADIQNFLFMRLVPMRESVSWHDGSITPFGQ
jgi:hypothetical protein